VAAVGVVAVLGGAGFLGYSQLAAGDADSDVPAPVAVAPPARYTVPAALGGLTQISPAQAKAMTERYTNLARNSLPDLPAPLVVTGFQAAGASTPGVNVVVYRAGAQGEATLDALVGNLSSPAPGNASIPAITTPGGAVGGSMLCGAQRGSTPTAWCAWRSAKGVGFVRALGTDNPNYAAAYTRELRAFAER
jgi:hypothetical protein